MKKTLIASAVAAAALTTNAFADGHECGASWDFYGNVQITYAHDVSTDNNLTGDAKETTANETQDNGSTIGFKGEAPIAEGLMGFGKIEFDQIDTDGDRGNNNAINRVDESYLGVKGDFGFVQVGKDETVYDDYIDIIDFSEYSGVAGDISGMDGADQIRYEGSFDELTVGLSYAADSDVDAPVRAAIVGAYAMDSLNLHAAYALGRDKKEGDTIGLAAVYGMDELTLGLQIELHGETESNSKDSEDHYAVYAGYTMGATALNFAYQIYNQENGGGNTEKETTGFTLNAVQSLGENMYVYAEYTATATEQDLAINEDTEFESFAIGATYSF